MAGQPDSALLREFDFSDADFQRVRSLVHKRIGISLAQSKCELVYSRLSRRLRALGLSDFDAYLKCVESGDEQELQHFSNAITTNLTSFFRENHHFEFLANELLPALARSRQESRRIRIWSAGCSTGEEAYSIAMVILECLSHLRDWDIRVLATDIDTNVLNFARRGLYPGERLEKMDGDRVLRWFERSPDAQYRVHDELRSLITFNELNLVGHWPMAGPFDVIFCRNVVIYFDRETQRQIIARMAALQRLGDHLLVGHSESLRNVSSQYRLVRNTSHCRIA